MSIDPSLEFIEFIPISENQLHQYEPLAGSYAIIQVETNVLFAFNRFRQR